LLRGPATARELSERVAIREKTSPGHLEHVEKSLRARGERLVVDPAACIACGYSFARRKAPDAAGLVSGMRIDAHRSSGIPDRGGLISLAARVVQYE